MDDGAPSQPIDESLKVDISATAVAMERALLDRLWVESGSASWGLEQSIFERVVLAAGLRQNFGLTPGVLAGSDEQAGFFERVKLADLVLASACAEGNERAWEHFMSAYGSQLTRAAIAISGSETVGRDLTDAFYAELYGLNTREGKRKCPLESYRGRGSLLGWLRTTLSQRFVDHYRRTFREEALDERKHDSPVRADSPQLDGGNATMLRDAFQEALSSQPAEERFVLAAYYLDDRTLAEIGKLLHVHEATISRRVKKSTQAIHKQVLKLLETKGLSRSAAEEAMGTDPRDLELGMDLKKLLQYTGSESFHEQAGSGLAIKSGSVTGAMLADSSASRAGEANSER